MASQARVCVFVDGENFRHSIIDLFPGQFNPSDYLPKQARWEDFYNYLVELSVGDYASLLRTYWYVVQYVDFFPYKMPKYDGDPENGKKLVGFLSKRKEHRDILDKAGGQGEKFREANKIRSQVLRQENRFKRKFEGWQKIQDGICVKHRSIEFRRAGSIHFNTFEKRIGSEKAVDVKLATDMVLLRDVYDVAIIVSGDQDYVPAVQAVKDRGKRVVNIAFVKRNGKLLPGGARRLNQITDDRIEIPYEKFKEFLKVNA